MRIVAAITFVPKLDVKTNIMITTFHWDLPQVSPWKPVVDVKVLKKWDDVWYFDFMF